MKASEALIYQGDAFPIEWYFDRRGRSPALDYYHSLSLPRRVKALKLIRLMGDVGKIFDGSKFRSEGHQIFAFKPQPDRYLCFFFEGRKLVITNAFEKKTQKLPAGEKQKALQAKRDYQTRIEQGGCYEQE